MKAIFYLAVTNLTVMLAVSVVLDLLGIKGEGASGLLVLCLVWGMAGSLLSVLVSKQVAKASVGAVTLKEPTNEAEFWLLDTVAQLSSRAGIGTPEVAVYAGPPNAFATGAFRDSSLVAVSTGLVGLMDREEITAVLAHEIGHIANRDVLSLSLVQGVMNAFVMWLSRIVASVLGKNRMAEILLVFGLQLVFGLLASLVVLGLSRSREYAADAKSAALYDKGAMVRALRKLQGTSSHLPAEMQAFGIASGSLMGLFATHPSIDDRITALLRERS